MAQGFQLRPPIVTHVTSRSGRDHDCPHHFCRVQTSSEGHPGAHSVCSEVLFPVTKQPEREAQFRIHTAVLPIPSYAYKWLMPIAAGLSTRRASFDPKSLRFAALGRPFLTELQFSPDSVIPPMLETHLHLPLTICSTDNLHLTYITASNQYGTVSYTIQLYRCIYK